MTTGNFINHTLSARIYQLEDETEPVVDWLNGAPMDHPERGDWKARLAQINRDYQDANEARSWASRHDLDANGAPEAVQALEARRSELVTDAAELHAQLFATYRDMQAAVALLDSAPDVESPAGLDAARQAVGPFREMLSRKETLAARQVANARDQRMVAVILSAIEARAAVAAAH